MTISRLEFRAMGSKVLVVQDGAEADPERSPVPGWFEEWEQILSRFRWDSELTRVNTMCGSAVQLSEQFWNVLLAAVRFSAAALLIGPTNARDPPRRVAVL